MRTSRIEKWIIGALLLPLMLAVTGCSNVRLAYGNAPFLTWWWIDGYADFDREQTPQVKQAIDRLFTWHRATQLPDYVGLLATAQAQALEPTTAAAVCRWEGQVRDKLEPTLQRTLAAAAELLPSLQEAQFKHIEREYGKKNEEMQDEFLQPDPARRRAASVKRAVERAEKLYGRLDAPQKRVIEDGVAASPFDPELWKQERLRRQRDTLQTLRKLAAERADADKSLTALRLLVAHVERSPNPDYRSYQLKLSDYNCGLAAQLHNATNPAQRQRARETFKGWEDDLKALIAG